MHGDRIHPLALCFHCLGLRDSKICACAMRRDESFVNLYASHNIYLAAAAPCVAASGARGLVAWHVSLSLGGWASLQCSHPSLDVEGARLITQPTTSFADGCQAFAVLFFSLACVFWL